MSGKVGRPSPAMVVAIIALVFGLTGGAVAATVIDGRQLRPNSVASDKIRNGTLVLKDGQPTGASAGRVVRGPGWTGWPDGGACPKS